METNDAAFNQPGDAVWEALSDTLGLAGSFNPPTEARRDWTHPSGSLAEHGGRVVACSAKRLESGPRLGVMNRKLEVRLS